MKSASADRATRFGLLRMLAMLIDTATKISPANAAEAPTSAEKSADQSAALYADPIWLFGQG
jgi:hypothetical protein